MADARVKQQWSHTSSLMALIANVNRSSKQRPAKPAEFDPTLQTNADDPESKPVVGVEALKAFLPANKPMVTSP